MSIIFLLVLPVLLGFGAQLWLSRTVKRHSAEGFSMTGAEVAQRILDANGITNVRVEPSDGGALSDHYDPGARTVRLSDVVYGRRSITAAAIAAHEVGHAIQHARAYAPLRFRSAMFPAVAIASNAWIFLFFAGVILQALNLIVLAVALYAVAVLFHIVTLPVEFDASRRAMNQMRQLGMIAEADGTGARRVLTAAALTYVVGALIAIMQLAYFVFSMLGQE